MKRKILLLAIAGVIFVLLTSVTYTCIKKYCNNRDATLVYREGLKKVYDKDNAFTPEAQLAFYDSLELLTDNSERKALGIQYFKSWTLLKMGQEKKAVDILTAILEKSGDLHEPQITNDIRKRLHWPG